VTISESKEREKGEFIIGDRDRSRDGGGGGGSGFFLCQNNLVCKENGGLVFSVGGRDHFFKRYDRDRQTL
jgi:hypothetical protein